GIAMGSVAASRRTQSAYPRFLASTNPSDLVASLSQQDGTSDAVAASIEARIGRVAGVTRVRRYAGLLAAQVGPGGAPVLGTVNQVDRYGSVDGLLFDQDRLTVVHGRMADPRRMDEVVMTPLAAQVLGLHLGDVTPWELV